MPPSLFLSSIQYVLNFSYLFSKQTLLCSLSISLGMFNTISFVFQFHLSLFPFVFPSLFHTSLNTFCFTVALFTNYFKQLRSYKRHKSSLLSFFKVTKDMQRNQTIFCSTFYQFYSIVILLFTNRNTGRSVSLMCHSSV